MNSIMLTICEYPDHPDWKMMIHHNRDRYCKLLGGQLVCTTFEVSPSRLCWARIPNILEALEAHDRVMWVDADAVLCGDINEEDLPDRLAFAHDAGGINDGITVTVKKDIPLWKAVWGLRDLYANHPIDVNGVFRDINPIHDILALDMWNSRWENHYMKIRHFPGEVNRYEKVKAECERVMR